MSTSTVQSMVEVNKRQAMNFSKTPGDDSATEKQGPPPCPEGGLQGWLVVLGTMIVMACSFGYISCFGVFQAYYQEHQLWDRTSSDIAWIGSLQVALQFASGLLAGSLFDRYGARVLLIPASVGYVLSVMLTSICSEYWHFILAQGLLGGTCSGFLFTPSLGCVNHYFMKKRGMAIGIAAAGSSIGGVVFPAILQATFDSKSLGFGWGVRIIGFGMLAFLTVACIVVKGRLPPRYGSFFVLEAFLQPSYALLISGIFFILWGMWVPFFFVSTYGIAEIHMSSTLAFYLLSILNGVSLFGRIISGVVADKLGWLNMLIFIGLVNAVLLFSWPSTHSNSGLIIWVAVFGYTSGAIFSLFPAAFAYVTPKPQLIGTYLGQALAILAVSGLTGSPIAGAMVAKYGFAAAAYFAGASMLVGSAFVAMARFAHSTANRDAV